MDTSTTRTSFCTQWSRGAKRPHQVIGDAEARERHQRGELYTAILYDDRRPYCFLEFSAYRSVCVEFLDLALRTFFHYSFQEMRPNELFISMSRRPEFPNAVDPPDRATVLFFKIDGQLNIVRYEAHANGVGSRIVGEEQRMVDVTRNWEPYPKFGDYQGLAKLDRGTPLLCAPNPRQASE